MSDAHDAFYVTGLMSSLSIWAVKSASSCCSWGSDQLYYHKTCVSLKPALNTPLVDIERCGRCILPAWQSLLLVSCWLLGSLYDEVVNQLLAKEAEAEALTLKKPASAHVCPSLLFKLKADRPHPRDYSKHRQIPRTDNDPSLLFAVHTRQSRAH